MLPIIPTGNSTKKPSGGDFDNQMTTLGIASQRMNNRRLEMSSHLVRCLKRKGQGELMGSIHCTRIPFILITIHQSHLSPLLDLYSANPLADLKTHYSTDAVVLFSLSWFSQVPMLMNLCSMFRFSLSQSCLITPSFHNQSDSTYCQPHSDPTAYTFFIVIYF